MGTQRAVWLTVVIVLASCDASEPRGPPEVATHPVERGLAALGSIDPSPVAAVSVAAQDRSTTAAAAGSGSLPVEARFLILSADGSEPELSAIRAVLDYRGVPYDIF